MKKAVAIMIPLSLSFQISSQSGYVCMVFYRRDNHVVEFQAGDAAPAPEEACSTYYFNPVPGHYTTLIGMWHWKQRRIKREFKCHFHFSDFYFDFIFL